MDAILERAVTIEHSYLCDALTLMQAIPYKNVIKEDDALGLELALQSTVSSNEWANIKMDLFDHNWCYTIVHHILSSSHILVIYFNHCYYALIKQIDIFPWFSSQYFLWKMLHTPLWQCERMRYLVDDIEIACNTDSVYNTQIVLLMLYHIVKLLQ